MKKLVMVIIFSLVSTSCFAEKVCFDVSDKPRLVLGITKGGKLCSIKETAEECSSRIVQQIFQDETRNFEQQVARQQAEEMTNSLNEDITLKPVDAG